LAAPALQTASDTPKIALAPSFAKQQSLRIYSISPGNAKGVAVILKILLGF
jgi:hypothetical protein